VRVAAIQLYRDDSLYTPAVASALMKALDDPDKAVSVTAMYTLGMHAEPQVLDRLLAQAKVKYAGQQ
jgi:hypothetical protein